MRVVCFFILAAALAPLAASAAERPGSRADESHVQQIDPRLKVRGDAPAAKPGTGARPAVPPPNEAVRCTPDNATSPECSAAVIQGGRGN